MRYVVLLGEARTQNRQATELKGIKFARTMLSWCADMSIVSWPFWGQKWQPQGWLGTQRQQEFPHRGERRNWTQSNKIQWQISLSTSKLQKRQEPLVYENPFCQPETFLAAWPFFCFLLSLTVATIPPTTTVWPSPTAHSLVCPCPFLLLVFAATSHCPEGKHANHWLNRFGEEIRRAGLTFQPLCGRIREKAITTIICSIITAFTDFLLVFSWLFYKLTA